jgi:hypothetical protein
VVDPDCHLADGVDPLGHGFDRKLREDVRDADNPVDGAVDGVDGSGAGVRVGDHPSVRVDQPNRRGGDAVVATRHLDMVQLPGLGLDPVVLSDKRFEVAVRHFFLLVGDLLEAGEGAVQVVLAQLVAQLL